MPLRCGSGVHLDPSDRDPHLLPLAQHRHRTPARLGTDHDLARKGSRVLEAVRGGVGHAAAGAALVELQPHREYYSWTDSLQMCVHLAAYSRCRNDDAGQHDVHRASSGSRALPPAPARRDPDLGVAARAGHRPVFAQAGMINDRPVRARRDVLMICPWTVLPSKEDDT